jgi:hypothetical protein
VLLEALKALSILNGEVVGQPVSEFRPLHAEKIAFLAWVVIASCVQELPGFVVDESGRVQAEIAHDTRVYQGRHVVRDSSEYVSEHPGRIVTI